MAFACHRWKHMAFWHLFFLLFLISQSNILLIYLLLFFICSGSKLEIKKEENENNYIFVQGGIEKTGSSITMVTKNTTPQPSKYQ